LAKLLPVAALLKEPIVAQQIRESGIEPADVEQFAIFSFGPEKGSNGGSSLPGLAMVFRFSTPMEPRAFLVGLPQLFGQSKPDRDTIVEVQSGGRTCYKDLRQSGVVCHAPDPHTLIITDEYRLHRMLAADKPSSALAEQLRQAGPKAEAVLAAALDPVREQILEAQSKADQNTPPLMAVLLEILPILQSGMVAVSFSDGFLVRAEFAALDADRAATLAELTRQLGKLAATQLTAALQELAPERQTELQPVLALVAEVLQKLTVKQEGKRVAIHIPRPQTWRAAETTLAEMAVQAVRSAAEAARDAALVNNLSLLALAMHAYHGSRGHFPAAAICDKEGKPLLSWRVAVLPILGEKVLYDQFRQDEPWDSPHNLKLARQMPAFYKSPRLADEQKTSFMLVTGQDTVFTKPSTKPSMDDVGKPIGQRIMLVEVGEDKAVIWTKPEDVILNLDDPLSALGKLRPEGFWAVFFDGHVERLPSGIEPQRLKDKITPPRDK
jgi:hypothetical protein